MSKKEVEQIEYNEETQKLLIEFMVSCEDLFVRSQNIIKPEYWDTKFRPAVKFIKKYADEFKRLPTTEQLYAETNLEFIANSKLKDHGDWFLKTIEQFCRHKSMEKLILEGPELLDKYIGSSERAVLMKIVYWSSLMLHYRFAMYLARQENQLLQSFSLMNWMLLFPEGN